MKKGRSEDLIVTGKDKVSSLQGLCLMSLLETMSPKDLNKMNGLINQVRKKEKGG